MITVNMDKAKQIAHTYRREARSWEFKPLDAMIASQIPGVDVVAVEAQRQAIRDKYAAMQQQIDAATAVSELETLPIYQP
jgi:hypothetical protein